MGTRYHSILVVLHWLLTLKIVLGLIARLVSKTPAHTDTGNKARNLAGRARSAALAA